MENDNEDLENKSSEELLKIMIKENRSNRADAQKTDKERYELILWDGTQQTNADADSRTGWSTAFFALVISSLLAVGFGVGTTTTWYIVGPIMILPLISIILLIVAMNPHPTHELAIKKFMEEELVSVFYSKNKYEKSNKSAANFEDLKEFTRSSVKMIKCRNVQEALTIMYKLINRKRFLLETAYKITFPFLIPFMLSHKSKVATIHMPKNEK